MMREYGCDINDSAKSEIALLMRTQLSAFLVPMRSPR